MVPLPIYQLIEFCVDGLGEAYPEYSVISVAEPWICDCQRALIELS